MKKPTITTPDTLIIAVWVDEGRAGITATLRTATNDVRPGVAQATGETLLALAGILEDLTAVKASNLLLLTNDGVLLQSLRRPWRFSAMHPTTWPPEYWTILRCCTAYCFSGAWQTMQAQNLQKARELWLQL
jgi:hypothetical protein